MDFSMSVVAAILGLGLGLKGDTQLYTPKQGSILLLNSQKCERKSLHTDLNPTLGDGQVQAGYVIMLSGENGFEIWICPRSHHGASS